MKSIFQVSIPNTFHDFFDYFADKVEPVVGARVWVPFRKQTRLGIVVGILQEKSPHQAVKTITTVIDDTPVLTGELLALCQWVSFYYQAPLSEVLPLALPKKYRTHEDVLPPVVDFYQITMAPLLAHQLLGKRAPRQHALIDFFSDTIHPIPKKQVLEAGFHASQLNRLEHLNILLKISQREKPISYSQPSSKPLSLNPEQALAVQCVSEHLTLYQSFLLQGVTGSGKTEVYLQVIDKVLALQRQVLVLVPEIGLTPQLVARFKERLAIPIMVIHSGLNDTERQLAWLSAKEEEAKLIIGTRSAVFTPMPALGLIIIDEEHDASFKQMEGVRYSARDTALMRAYLRHIPIILGSATPSLESLHNASLQKYALLRLNQKALNSKALHYQILDVRNLTLEHGMALQSIQMIKEHLKAKNQVLVFINRRGFAPVLLCHQCGWMADCKGCDAHLILHKSLNRLVCHHCGLTEAIPHECKNCHGRQLLPVGAGTQRIHEYLTSQFPTTSILRIDRDEVRKKEALNERLGLINDGNAELIVGTQMLAKGHHFPRLTLVVVLDADNGFYNQDFRALERLGQLITQVAGRAGRAEFPGHVLIQTHLPNHPMLNLLIQQGYDAFAQSLLTLRQQAELPPYYFLSVIRAQGKSLASVLHFLNEVKAQLCLYEMNVLGPAPAPLARKAGLHRMQLLVKSHSRIKLGRALTQIRGWLTMNKIGNGIRWSMDVDPVDLT